jgi:predicted RNA-binding protein with RPS1 domain/GrpB-like predicted nucleotidyltransferase (UPF0157 family)
VVRYDDEWPRAAARLAARLRKVCGPAALAVEHLGSTAVPGMAAVDVVDLQIEVADADAADALGPRLAAAGFPRRDDAGDDAVVAGVDPDPAQWRRRLHSSADPGRPANVHVRVAGSAGARAAVALRDLLRRDPPARADLEPAGSRLAVACADREGVPEHGTTLLTPLHFRTLAEGERPQGGTTTTSCCPLVNFGAFVDLGGVDGLVHVSELSWKHIDHPSEVVEVGQEVTVEVLDVDLDRERVSLSLKATQEDPWQQFARTHAIAQVVPGKVTKLVPFGAFVRVDEGIEGLVHISELAERHVEIPEQVVNVGEELLVKVIDIDLERRRISLSLKQANDTGFAGEAVFDPAQYGMSAQYDDAGQYIYPEGFDADTGEWLPGYETQRDEWEAQYAAAQKRFDAHQEQIKRMAAADAEAALPTSYTSATGGEDGEETEGTAPEGEAAAAPAARPAPAPTTGPLASDEALQALREKLSGGGA